MSIEAGKPAKLDPSAVISAISAKATHGIMGTIAKIGNIAKLGKFVHIGVINGREFLLSLVILVVCIAIIVLIYILIRVIRLRGFAIGHSENVNDFMDAFHSDIDTTRKLFSSLEVSKASFNAGNTNLLDLLNCGNTIKYFESNSNDVLSTNFDTYFKYYDIMQSGLDQWFHSKDLDTFAKGNLSGPDYLKQLIKTIDSIRNEVKTSIATEKYMPTVQRAIFLCSSLTSEQYKGNQIPSQSTPAAVNLAQEFVKSCNAQQMSHELFTEYIQQFIDVCVGIQVMHLYLNVYFDDIKDLHNSRRFSFFNFLIILIKPYVKNLIFDSIVEPAKELFSSDGIKKEKDKCVIAWMGIGQKLIDLPKSLAAGSHDPPPNTDNFTQTNASANKHDVVEHMGIGGLFTGILKIGEFFAELVEVAVALATLVANFISDPIGTIFGIIKIIIGLVIGFVLLLIWAILSLPPFIYIIFGIYFFIFDIVLFAVMSLWYVLLFTLFAIISAILWVLDLMLSAFNGFTAPSIIATMGRCENLPDVWYTRGSFIDDNNYNRAFLCQSPCASRFKPNGLFCTKLNGKQPSFCPQAQAFRIYKGMSTTPNPVLMGDFNPDPTFWTKTEEGRKLEIKNYFINRQEFLSKCSKANEPYNNLIKTVCANWDTVNLPNEGDRDNLRKVCRQIYCDGDPKEEFCYKFTDKNESEQDAPETSDDILKRIMKLLVIIIISVIVILMFIYNS